MVFITLGNNFRLDQIIFRHDRIIQAIWQTKHYVYPFVSVFSLSGLAI